MSDNSQTAPIANRSEAETKQERNDLVSYIDDCCPDISLTDAQRIVLRDVVKRVYSDEAEAFEIITINPEHWEFWIKEAKRERPEENLALDKWVRKAFK